MSGGLSRWLAVDINLLRVFDRHLAGAAYQNLPRKCLQGIDMQAVPRTVHTACLACIEHAQEALAVVMQAQLAEAVWQALVETVRLMRTRVGFSSHSAAYSGAFRHNVVQQASVGSLVEPVEEACHVQGLQM